MFEGGALLAQNVVMRGRLGQLRRRRLASEAWDDAGAAAQHLRRFWTSSKAMQPWNLSTLSPHKMPAAAGERQPHQSPLLHAPPPAACARAAEKAGSNVGTSVHTAATVAFLEYRRKQPDARDPLLSRFKAHTCTQHGALSGSYRGGPSPLSSGGGSVHVITAPSLANQTEFRPPCRPFMLFPRAEALQFALP